MEHVSARDARRQGAHSRRWRMREQARSQHTVLAPGPAPGQAPVSDRYQTPEWLERSFVLPLTQPEASDVPSNVPSQAVRRHDDDPERAPEEAMTSARDDALPEPAPEPVAHFVRPPSEDIDFARVIRRSDLTRKVTRLHWVATGLAGLTLVLFLLTGSAVALGGVALFALVAVAAFGVRISLHRAPVPRLER